MFPSFDDYSCFVICGKTDMRCGIHSLAHKVQDDLEKDLFNKSLFIFCGGSGYRTLKILTWEPTGFYLITKQVIPSSRGFCWPKNRTDAEQTTQKVKTYIRHVAKNKILHLPKETKVVDIYPDEDANLLLASNAHL